MAKQTEPDINILLAEYKEAGDAMRAHAETRWKLLGVVIPISGGILSLSVQFPELKISLNFLGLFAACLFALLNIAPNWSGTYSLIMLWSLKKNWALLALTQK